MMPDDQDAHLRVNDSEQEVVGEAIEIAPAKVALPV